MDKHGAINKNRIRDAHIAKLNKMSQVKEIATIEAVCGERKWPVVIQSRGGEWFYIAGEATRLDTYITETLSGYLVSVVNFNRCGHVPENPQWHDIMDYMDIDNKIDAITLATALRHIIESNLVPKHPEIGG